MTVPSGDENTRPYTGEFDSFPHSGAYGGLGVYGRPPEKPARSRKALLVASAAVAVMLIVVGVGAGILLSRQRPEIHAVASPATTSAALKPLAPRTPGWQTAVSNKRGAAYDVPKAQWALNDPDDIVGFGPPGGPGDVVTGTGAAEYMRGYCAGQPNSARAGTAVTAADNVPRDKSAPDIARRWAALAYHADNGPQPEVTLEPSKAIKVADGKVDATLAVADVTQPAATDPCTAKTAKVYATAVTGNQNGSVLLVLYADQGVPGALGDADVMKIMTSMRPSD
ncbi:MAG: hypothetical protein JOZ47_20610 [Kutzneria sp.]|nr:hypothetical protein [Kutzneria sp.]